jgi:hypothetical protein
VILEGGATLAGRDNGRWLHLAQAVISSVSDVHVQFVSMLLVCRVWVAGASATTMMTPVWNTRNVANVTSTPGSRRETCGVVDSAGNLLLYGGVGAQMYNDLWSFNPTTLTWVWRAGSQNFNQQPDLSKGKFSPYNGTTIAAGSRQQPTLSARRVQGYFATLLSTISHLSSLRRCVCMQMVEWHATFLIWRLHLE